LLCFTFYFFRDLEHYGVDRVLAEISQKMGQNLANVFFVKQGRPLSGDVLNIRRHQNSIYVPKMGVLVLTFFHVFGPVFLGIFRIFSGREDYLSTFKYII
jgi:hypothetical protein